MSPGSVTSGASFSACAISASRSTGGSSREGEELADRVAIAAAGLLALVLSS